MDVRTESGDVYMLDENRILVYGSGGIELQLGQRNLEVLRGVAKTLNCVKDTDSKDRRFTVGYDILSKKFRFEPFHGEVVRVDAWNILPEILESKT